MTRTRHAGVLVPLFSVASKQNWGIGEFPDLAHLADWSAAAGVSRVMLLPLGTMAPGQASPYSASSAMGLDPLFVHWESVEDFEAAGGVARLSPEARAALARARAGNRVRYDDVRRAKGEAESIAFARFAEREAPRDSPRYRALQTFAHRERWWLADYALFQALSAHFDGRPWRAWPLPLTARNAGALAEARRYLAADVLKQQYLQWLAAGQWQQARTAAAARGVELYGDLPFMVDANSADVWVRPGEFLVDVSVGVPPDSFSATGQDWSLPMYRWDVMAAGDFEWIAQRARRMAALYDGFRVDHLVGFYRTYGRPLAGDPFFLPPDPATQLWQGERVLHHFLSAGATVVAEDLGTVPDFVRESLMRLGVPGYKVLRWERHYDRPGQPFVDPSEYPARSIATTGTHDTEPLAEWWDNAGIDERRALVENPFFASRSAGDAGAAWNDALRDAILELMLAATSEDVFMPMQDVFGWRARINIPGTVSDDNWSWRLPWAIDEWRDEPEASERAEAMRAAAERAGRTRPTEAGL